MNLLEIIKYKNNRVNLFNEYLLCLNRNLCCGALEYFDDKTNRIISVDKAYKIINYNENKYIKSMHFMDGNEIFFLN